MRRLEQSGNTSSAGSVVQPLVLLALLCLGLPLPTQAASNPELSLRLGPAVPSGDFTQVAGPAAFLSGMILGHADAPLSFGIEVGGNLGHNRRRSGIEYETTIIQVTPVFRLGLRLPHGALLYLLGGMGYYLADYQLNNAASHTEHDFGLNGGGGLLLRLTEHTRAGLEFRFHHLVESGIEPNYFVPVVLITYVP